MRKLAMVAAALFALILAAGCKGAGETPAQPAAPQAETSKPKAEAPKTEAPKTEVPKAVAPKPAVPVAPAAGEVVLEVESFTLTKAAIKDLAGASGGKAVLFDNADESSATKEVQLKAGKYEAVVHVQAPDEDKDAFYLKIGDDENRLFPSDYGKVLPSQPAAFTVKADGAVKVELKASEEAGVLLDRVVIRPAK